MFKESFKSIYNKYIIIFYTSLFIFLFEWIFTTNFLRLKFNFTYWDIWSFLLYKMFACVRNKECGCNVIGSLSQQCNANTGCCFCRDSFRGEKCDECQIGYRDFPQVRGQTCLMYWCYCRLHVFKKNMHFDFDFWKLNPIVEYLQGFHTDLATHLTIKIRGALKSRHHFL